MQQTFVPRTAGVYSGDVLVLWSNAEVRELYAEIERLEATRDFAEARQALQTLVDLWESRDGTHDQWQRAWHLAKRALV